MKVDTIVDCILTLLARTHLLSQPSWKRALNVAAAPFNLGVVVHMIQAKFLEPPRGRC